MNGRPFEISPTGYNQGDTFTTSLERAEGGGAIFMLYRLNLGCGRVRPSDGG